MIKREKYFNELIDSMNYIPATRPLMKMLNKDE